MSNFHEPTLSEGSLVSRHLGELNLVGGPGGAVAEHNAAYGPWEIPVRIELDYPTTLSALTITKIDLVLDNYERFHEMAQDPIVAALETDTPVRDVFLEWQEATGTESDDPAHFLASLRPRDLTILPDGKISNQDRIVVTYGYDDSPLSLTFRVRFLDQIGPVIARG